MSERARAFVAIAPGEVARARLVETLGQLEGVGGDVRWVGAGKHHVTLRFLGEVPRDALGDLGDALSEVPSGALRLGLGAVGQFPPRGQPRVLWVGLAGGLERLSRLAADVESACRRWGAPRERRAFRPHVTLARVRGVRGVQDALDAVARVDLRTAPEPIASMALYESELGPEGATYRVVRELPLGAQP